MAELDETNPSPEQKNEAHIPSAEASDSKSTHELQPALGKGRNLEPLPRVAPLMYDEDYLKNRLEDQMNWYDRKSSWNQRMYKRYKNWEFIIAATVPFFVGLSQINFFQGLSIKFGTADQYEFGAETVFNLLAGLGGVVLLILKNRLELEEYYKLWKEYRATAEALQQERVKYLTRTEPYDESDAFPLLVEKVESILNNETQKWKISKPVYSVPKVKFAQATNDVKSEEE